MELRGSGPISGPMGGGGAGRLRVNGCEMIGLLKLYETVFFDLDVVSVFSFMVKPVFEAVPARAKGPEHRSKSLFEVVFYL